MKTAKDFNPYTLYGIYVDIEYNEEIGMSPQEIVAWFRSDECREMIGEEDYPEYLEAVEFVLNDNPAWSELLKLW